MGVPSRRARDLSWFRHFAGRKRQLRAGKNYSLDAGRRWLILDEIVASLLPGEPYAGEESGRQRKRPAPRDNGTGQGLV